MRMGVAMPDHDKHSNNDTLRKVSVGEGAYREAVIALFVEAMSDTQRSDAASNILLSVYDESSFCVTVGDFRTLGIEHFHEALILLRGKVIHNFEPHLFLEHGAQKFKSLLAKNQHLHVNRRFF